MTYSDLILFFIFGTIIGSFVNVIIYRYNSGRSSITGRSKCFSCGKNLSWYELIPIFSFLFLKGKCLSCKSKISYQYILVELLTGLLFVGIIFKFGISIITILYLIITTILVVISVYDFKHKIIPNGMVFYFDLFSLMILLASHKFYGPALDLSLLDLSAGPILFCFFALLWLISKGRWMGFGDAKLALGVGWFLGFYGGISGIMLSFWIGAVVSLLILFLQKINRSKLGLTLKSEIPFAPFIIIALFIQIFTEWNFFTLMNF